LRSFFAAPRTRLMGFAACVSTNTRKDGENLK